MNVELRKVDLCDLESELQRIITAYPANRVSRNVHDALHNVLDCIDQERELL